jgi:hypothetical protein
MPPRCAVRTKFLLSCVQIKDFDVGDLVDKKNARRYDDCLSYTMVASKKVGRPEGEGQRQPERVAAGPASTAAVHMPLTDTAGGSPHSKLGALACLQPCESVVRYAR